MKKSKIPKQILSLLLVFALVLTNMTTTLSVFAETDPAEDALNTYLSQKIITSGGPGVVKKDNVTYDIGLKTSSGGTINSVRFRNAQDGYTAAWKVNSDSAEYLNAKSAYTYPSKSILKRPASKEAAFPAKVTVMLFKNPVEESDINNDTAVPVATKEITLNILPEASIYNVTFEAVNSKTKAPVKNAAINVEKDWNTVTPEEGGIYKMPEGQSYSVTAEAEGYRKYINSSFTATADGKVELPLEEIVKCNVKFKVQNKRGEVIPDYTLTLKKGSATIQPEKDGSYNLEADVTYSYTVTAKGFKEYSDTITPEADKPNRQAVTLEPVVLHKITFNIKDKSGRPVEGAALKVRKGFDEVEPEADGSYLLEEDAEYKYSVTKSNYEMVNKSFTVTKEETIDVVLTKDITDYNVTINVVDQDGNPVDNASVDVEYYDEFEFEFYTINPVSGTTYKLDKYTEYVISVKAPGYDNFNNSSYTPSGDEENITYDVVLKGKESPDQAKADAIKKKYDAEFGALRPKFSEYKNINAFMEDKIKGYTDLDTEGVTVEVATTDDPLIIADDGKISYIAAETPSPYGTNSQNVSCTFKIKCGKSTAVTSSRAVTVGWDRNHVNSRIEAESELMTAERILGENKDINSVTSDLILPRCMGTSLKTAWSVTDWSSSDPSVISVEKPDPDTALTPATGKVHPQSEDKEVTLTAEFKVNDVILNSYVETPEDFKTFKTTIKVTVKGTAPPAPAEEELLSLLDRYYTVERITDSITGKPADLNHLKGDITLPRYTKIKDEEGKLVFENKEIQVTSDHPALTITGYRGNVDIFQEKDTPANLIVQFTRQGVTVTKKIPVTIIAVTDEELDRELKLMKTAKSAYYDGINDNQNKDKNAVTENLHAFKEMRLGEDQKPLWIYDAGKTVGDGIIPDNFFEDPWEMEGAGYNKFMSSEPSVITHDNLLVIRPENSAKVTVSSLLSSAKYGKYAPSHPENEKLQKLYKQKVSTTVTVKGTKAAKEALKKEIADAEKFLESMTEGNKPGNYPEGKKAELSAAIKAAEDILNDDNAEEAAAEQAVTDLSEAVHAVYVTCIPKVAENMILTGNYEKNKPGKTITADVKSDEAAKAGYYKPEEYIHEVTAIDAMVVLHRHIFGEDFDKDPQKYLVMGKNGWTTKLFGIDTMNSTFLVNDKFPTYPDDPEKGSVANDTVLKTSDRLSVLLLFSDYYDDYYLRFDTDVINTKQMDKVTLTLNGYMIYGDPSLFMTPKEGYTVKLTSEDNKTSYEGVTNAEGKVTFTIKEQGNFTATVTKAPEEVSSFAAPSAEIKVAFAAADYAAVDKALKAIPDDLSIYTDSSVKAVNEAKGNVVRNLDITKQKDVDKMADDINSAVKALALKPADYDAVDKALKNIPDDLSIYTEDSVKAVNEAKCNVVRDLDITKQKDVDKMAEDINTAIKNLTALEKISRVTLNEYFTPCKNGYKYRSRGKHVNAVPVVKDAKGNVLTKGTDYTVDYSDKNRTAPGKYTITVKGTGNYTGTIEKTLVITPEKVKNLNVRHSALKGGFDDAYITWKKTSGADGYQVYSRRPAKTSRWTLLGKTTKTHLLKKDLYDGYKYEFKVIPYVYVDKIKFRSSDHYHIDSFTTLKKVSKPSAKRYSSSKVKITWKDIRGESGYQVKASRKGKTSYFITSHASVKLHVAKNKKYTYKVRAYKNIMKNGKKIRVYAPWSETRTYTLK